MPEQSDLWHLQLGKVESQLGSFLVRSFRYSLRLFKGKLQGGLVVNRDKFSIIRLAERKQELDQIGRPALLGTLQVDSNGSCHIFHPDLASLPVTQNEGGSMTYPYASKVPVCTRDLLVEPELGFEPPRTGVV